MDLKPGDSIAILGDSGSTGGSVTYPGVSRWASRKDRGLEDDDWQHKPAAWVNRLREALPGVAIHNYSQGGWHVLSHLEHSTTLADAIALRPTVILVPLGINDRTHGHTPRQFGGHLKELVDRVRTDSPTTRIVLITEWSYGDEANRRELSRYWHQMAIVAAEHDLGLVRWHKRVRIPRWWPARRGFADWMHPNGRLNKKMAQLVLDGLKSL